VTSSAPHCSGSPDDTEHVGAALAEHLLPGDVVLLEGDLAAGKTTLVRGLVGGLHGPADEVSSPTFVLLQTYPCAAPGIERLHHVDLYRIADRVPDLRELGLDEVLSDAAAVTAVEWPKDALASWIPARSRLWRVRIEILDDDRRRLTIAEPTRQT
jgi:tRNA threonylcarbamoyladenosine biosynthesis protein TsaE